jgi:hydroxyacylglutathione hydrolase
MLEIRTIESMPFAENSYLLWLPPSKDAIIIDPGFEPDLILDAIEVEGLNLVAILNTHGHSDHIAGNAAMKEKYPDAPLIIGQNDAVMLVDPTKNLSRFFGADLISPPANQTVVDEELLEVAGFRFLVREIPGHSPGHVVFIYSSTAGNENEPEMHILGGDVLFRGSVGRTDFPGGSSAQLLAGIREKLFVLPDKAVVYPGHGPTTTIGYEKRTNPYLT